MTLRKMYDKVRPYIIATVAGRAGKGRARGREVIKWVGDLQ